MTLTWREKELNLTEVSWEEVRHDVHQVNPHLASMIDEVSKKTGHKLYRARYCYGDRIVTHGKFHLPLKGGGTTPLMDSEISSALQKHLGRKSVPMGLILTKSVEVFFETKRYVVPSKLFDPGKLFGLWEAFDPDPVESLVSIWNLTAGARTICMLPSISDAVLYKKLQRDYTLSSTMPPNKLLEHHDMFTELSRHIDDEQQKWYCDILFFSDDWLNAKIKPLNFENYLLKQAWLQSYNCRRRMDYDIPWETFHEEITARNWKPRPYNIAIIQHLLAIEDGIYPAFIPAYNNDAAPIDFLQECIIKSYQLRDYEPIIMQPSHFGVLDKTHYFSLSMPTQLEHLARSRKNATISSDLLEIKRMADLLASMGHSSLIWDFFHSDENVSTVINPSRNIVTMANHDTWTFKYKERKFPDKSPFFTGCISINKKKHS